MLGNLKNIFSKPNEILDSSPNKLVLEKAVSSLVIEAAMADGEFSDIEKKHIKSVLYDLFSFNDELIEDLIEETEQVVKKSSQLYGFSKTLRDSMEYQERLEIIQMMWEITYADGKLDDFEANLIRRASGLLYIDDIDCGTARKNAISHLGLDID
ncbi:MAG: TerB family tellurite resistance protein [Pseudomonadota bacterium]|nr:TerB family tellurite resistance protein [Pseudomonadota bacterium]